MLLRKILKNLSLETEESNSGALGFYLVVFLVMLTPFVLTEFVDSIAYNNLFLILLNTIIFGMLNFKILKYKLIISFILGFFEGVFLSSSASISLFFDILIIIINCSKTVRRIILTLKKDF